MKNTDALKLECRGVPEDLCLTVTSHFMWKPLCVLGQGGYGAFIYSVPDLLRGSSITLYIKRKRRHSIQMNISMYIYIHTTYIHIYTSHAYVHMWHYEI